MEISEAINNKDNAMNHFVTNQSIVLLKISLSFCLSIYVYIEL